MIAPIKQLTIRSATGKDLQALANLIHFEANVHRHLDWRPPLDWVGHEPYLVAEYLGRVQAALACPLDPPGIVWIRLFAVASALSPKTAWNELWPAAVEALQRMSGGVSVAAIPLQHWFRSLLEESGFTCTHRVVMLAWKGEPLPPGRASITHVIRKMNPPDLDEVIGVDTAAFGEVWQISRTCLELVYRQAAVATVVEVQGKIAGYQISTPTPIGGHLARLAVHPDYQGLGLGYVLVRDLLAQFQRRGARSVTVNTQHNNLASLSLYEKAGFRRTGEEYPVYQYSP